MQKEKTFVLLKNIFFAGNKYPIIPVVNEFAGKKLHYKIIKFV